MNTNATAAAKTEGQTYPDRVDIPLSKPLEIGGAKVKVLTMREPLVEDQLAAEEANATGTASGLEVALFSNLLQIAPQELKKLPMRDYAKLQAAYAGFTS